MMEFQLLKCLDFTGDLNFYGGDLDNIGRGVAERDTLMDLGTDRFTSEFLLYKKTV